MFNLYRFHRPKSKIMVIGNYHTCELLIESENASDALTIAQSFHADVMFAGVITENNPHAHYYVFYSINGDIFPTEETFEGEAEIEDYALNGDWDEDCETDEDWDIVWGMYGKFLSKEWLYTIL